MGRDAHHTIRILMLAYAMMTALFQGCFRRGDTVREAASAGNTMLGIVSLNARVVLNPLIVLDQLGCDAIGQVGRQMIEGSGRQCHGNSDSSTVRRRLASSDETDIV
jgi:hypothetical protein